MQTMTIDVGDLRKMIETALMGFRANESPEKPQSQIVMETAVRALYREEEMQLAAGVLLLYLARARGVENLHQALEVLMQRHIDSMPRRK